MGKSEGQGAGQREKDQAGGGGVAIILAAREGRRELESRNR
jgi:hypothetical protein